MAPSPTQGSTLKLLGYLIKANDQCIVLVKNEKRKKTKSLLGVVYKYEF